MLYSDKKRKQFQVVADYTSERYHEGMSVVPQVAIDMGSYCTRAMRSGNQEVFANPSVVEREVVSNEVTAIGSEVQVGSGQSRKKVYPVQRGVLADYEGGKELSRFALSQVLPWWNVFRPNVVLARSLKASSAVVRQTGEAVQSVGTRKVYMASVPALAALGVGISPTDPSGRCVVDIGAGTTEAAIISSGAVVVGESKSVGGKDITEALADYVHDQYGLTTEAKAVDSLKHEVGSALERDKEDAYELHGHDVKTGEPSTVEVTTNEVAQAIQSPLDKMADTITDVLKKTPVKLLADVTKQDVLLTGGTAQLENIDTHIGRSIGLSTSVANNPQTAAVRGGQEALSFVDVYQQYVPHHKINKTL